MEIKTDIHLIGLAAKPVVLVVDDEEVSRATLKAFYASEGFDVREASCPLAALEQLGQLTDVDLIVCDLMMPELDGLGFIARASELSRRPPIIIVTAHASLETAMEGLQRGAFDYITKPLNLDELGVISGRAVKTFQIEQRYLELKKKQVQAHELGSILGKSPQVQKVFDSIKRLSQSSCSVLITGESGTGKDLVARALHENSPRAAKPFVAINCSAIPDALLESELFGHVKGAFTGATERRRGLLEEAHEGTIFLDEIGDMPLVLQAKLLRFLQEKKIKAVGENAYRETDVRVIAATHMNLKESVKNQSFRKDLYFRLCVVPIEVAPLRHRKDDILLLSEYFLSKFSHKFNSRVLGFTKAALSKLTRLSWPGNVRELENAIERAVVFCEGKLIDENDIQVTELSEGETYVSQLFSGLKNLRELEQQYIEYVLAQTGNRREKASNVLGINRKTLYRKQKEYGLSLPRGA